LVSDYRAREAEAVLELPVSLFAQEVFLLGEDLLAWILLAIGGALAVGTALALVRPRPETSDDDDLERPPLARSVVMILVGSVAAVWGLASILQ
jgi:hypothetical protein